MLVNWTRAWNQIITSIDIIKEIIWQYITSISDLSKQATRPPPPSTHTKKNLKAQWEMEEISFSLIKNSYGKPRVEIILNYDILTACSSPEMRNKAGCPLSFPTQIYWSAIDIQNVIYLKCVVWWFDTYVHCGRIPTVELMHLSPAIFT